MNLRDYLHIVYQHKLLILLVTLVAGAGSFLLSIREPPKYQASAQLLLTTANLPSVVATGQNPYGNEQPDRIAATQARLARVPDVAARALDLAHRSDMTTGQLLRTSSVASDPVSDLLTFTVTNGHPSTAESLATAYATAFSRYRRSLDTAPFRAANARIATRAAALRRSGQTAGALYRSLLAQQQQLQTLATLGSSTTRVVSRSTSAARIQPRPARALAIGLPIGLLFGIVLAFLAHLLDRRSRTVAAVSDALGVPSLGWIPQPPRRFRNRLVMLDEPTSAYGEAFTSLRTNMELARRVHGGDVVLATTIGGRPAAKSTAIANLAIAYARAGFHVVLADLDLHQPVLADLFGLEPRFGVTEVLLGHAELHDALEEVQLRNAEFGGTLRVLPVAGRPANPTDVLATRRLAVVFERLRDEADLVLVDAPPLLEGSGTAAVSTHVDALALIAHIGHDRQQELAEARRRLSATTASALGVIGTGKGSGDPLYGEQRAPSRRLRQETVP